MILHLEQVNQLWHVPALFDYGVQVVVRIVNELFDGLLICKNAILFVVLEHTKVWLSRHQQTLLNNVNEAEA